MTETYQSLGNTASPAFTYIGVASLVLGSILTYANRNRFGAPLTRWSFICLMSLIIIVCGVFALPVAFTYVVIGMSGLFSFLFSRHDNNVTPKMRNLTLVVSSLTTVLFIFMGYMFADQKIILNQDSVTSIPTGMRSRHTEWRTMLAKSGLHVDATVYPGTPLIQRDPWIDWKLANGDTDRSRFYLHSGVIYWGPHGLISADQLARRIASWASIQPNYKKWDGAESDPIGTAVKRVASK